MRVLSFFFDGKTVTMGNYQTIFADYSADIVDEVRLAIMDDTAIGDYIAVCKDDSYRLGQIRKAIREYVPKEFISPYIDGQIMAKLRKAFADKVQLAPLLRYIKKGRLTISVKAFDCLIDMLSDGVSIEDVNFNKIKNSCVGIVCKGLRKNYPMWLFEGTKLEADRIELLMKGMHLGIDVQPLLSAEWTAEQIRAIFRYAKGADTNAIIASITPHFSDECIKEVFFAVNKNLDYTVLIPKDSEGYPLYNVYQMVVLNQAMLNGVLSDEMRNPSLSDMQMQNLFDDALAHNVSKMLGGTLPKK